MTVWVRDLLGLWACRDATAHEQNLGYPTVSAGFGLMSEEVDETPDTGGYSALELAAIGDAVIWLAREHPDHWRALSRDCRPWTRRTLAVGSNDQELVREATDLLAGFVNKALR